MPNAFLQGLDGEVDDTGQVTVATVDTGVWSSSSSIASKRMSRTSDCSPRTARAADNAISQ